MGYLSRAIERVGGRRVLLALGGAFVLLAAGYPILDAVSGESTGALAIVSVLVGGSGLVLTYSGYWLPQSNIRSDLYHVVAGWSIRAVEIMLGILLFISALVNLADPLANFLILPALASVAGLGMGIYDGRARTRALDAEESNRELKRYETIVETVNDGIFVADADNRFTLVNDAYCAMVGYDRDELLGSHTSLVTDTGTEDPSAILEEVERDLEAGSSESTKYETSLRTKSGETIQAQWSVAPLPQRGDGDPDRVVVVRDVTDRIERERRLEQQNRQLDNFASMLAHELRNPVTIGQIYSQQLSEEENQQAVEYITGAFDRMENMIDVMLLVARGREAISGCSTLPLAEVTREVWTEIDAPEATLEVPTDLTLEGDETYLRHLLRNLLENAVEHGDDDVTVTVGDLPTGFYVADDGQGIPSDDRDVVFETGYTTAEDNGGMGVGLTFVKEMADVYGWQCSVTESETGGARFEFENVVE